MNEELHGRSLDRWSMVLVIVTIVGMALLSAAGK